MSDKVNVMDSELHHSWLTIWANCDKNYGLNITGKESDTVQLGAVLNCTNSQCNKKGMGTF